MPHRAAGWRMEPPVSVPMAHGARPAAPAAALPPDEPPGTRSWPHGLRTGPKPEFSFDEPMANSSWLVLPSSGAPAAASCSTAVAGYGGRWGVGGGVPLGDPGAGLARDPGGAEEVLDGQGHAAELAAGIDLGPVLGHPGERVQRLAPRRPLAVGAP